MKYEKFEKIINNLKIQDFIIDDLYSKKVDLMEFVNPYNYIIETFIEEMYGEEGYDWVIWFCYENDFGSGELTANDDEGNPICYDVKSLWEYIETLKP